MSHPGLPSATPGGTGHSPWGSGVGGCHWDDSGGRRMYQWQSGLELRMFLAPAKGFVFVCDFLKPKFGLLRSQRLA